MGIDSYKQRKNRVRAKAKASARPRLSVFRSNKHIFAQIIDASGKVVATSSTKSLTKAQKEKAKTKMEEAAMVGETVANLAKKKKISKVVFDRGEYKYHGRVKALADGARKGGLNF